MSSRNIFLLPVRFIFQTRYTFSLAFSVGLIGLYCFMASYLFTVRYLQSFRYKLSVLPHIVFSRLFIFSEQHVFGLSNVAAVRCYKCLAHQNIFLASSQLKIGSFSSQNLSQGHRRYLAVMISSVPSATHKPVDDMCFVQAPPHKSPILFILDGSCKSLDLSPDLYLLSSAVSPQQSLDILSTIINTEIICPLYWVQRVEKNSAKQS